MDGFSRKSIATSGGMLNAMIGGEGPPLVLLHGFPQNWRMWARVAPALAKTRTVFCFDLPGYGGSDAPGDVESASKRAMAAQIVDAMAGLGHDRFDVAGHDRGGRVAYRMALDRPDAVARLAVLDIQPTAEYWDRMNHAFAMRIYHWPFLAQDYPLPEKLIGSAPDFYIDHTIASWTAAKSLSAFEVEALDSYRAQARDPVRLKAMCDDYRAGATVDYDHDRADRDAGHRITCPTLALWGGAGIASDGATPLETWQAWCEDASGFPIDSGHFIPEENPAATVEALDEFFS